MDNSLNIHRMERYATAWGAGGRGQEVRNFSPRPIASSSPFEAPASRLRVPPARRIDGRQRPLRLRQRQTLQALSRRDRIRHAIHVWHVVHVRCAIHDPRAVRPASRGARTAVGRVRALGLKRSGVPPRPREASRARRTRTRRPISAKSSHGRASRSVPSPRASCLRFPT